MAYKCEAFEFTHMNDKDADKNRTNARTCEESESKNTHTYKAFEFHIEWNANHKIKSSDKKKESWTIAYWDQNNKSLTYETEMDASWSHWWAAILLPIKYKMYKRKTEQISQCNKQLNRKNKITHIEVHENRTINRKKNKINRNTKMECRRKINTNKMHNNNNINKPTGRRHEKFTCT